MSQEHVDAAAQSYLAASEAGDDTIKERRALESALVASGVDIRPKEESFEVTWLSDVEEEEWEFLWRPWLPRGVIVMADGLPGVGKTHLILDLCARATSGAPWPCDQFATRREPEVVAIMSAEDSISKTIKKRMRLLGADMSRVAIIGDKTLRDPDTGEILSVDGSLQDIAALRKILEDIRPSIFLIDTMGHFLGPDVNTISETDIKRVLRPVKELAEEFSCTFILVRHHNKSGSTSGVQRGGGAIGISGQARLVMCIGTHKDDDSRGALFCAKTNVAAKPDPVEFLIDPDTHEFVWVGETDMVMTDVLTEADKPSRRKKRDDAGEWLKEFFIDGKMKRQDVLIAASGEAGFKWKTLTRAAVEDLGLVQKARRVKGQPGIDHYEWLPAELAAMEDDE